MEEENKYLIPPNIRQKFLLFDNWGIGWIELGIIGFGVIIGIMLFKLVGIFTPSLKRIFLFIIPSTLAFVFVLPFDYTGQSYLNRLIDFIHYKNTKKKHYFIAGRGTDQNV